jgi:hypothetical protein
MKSNPRFFRTPALFAVLIVCTFATTLIATSPSRAQEDERRLWDSEFLKKRQAAKPSATKPSATNQTPTKRHPAYRRISVKNPAIDEKAEGEMLGVTVWRLRPTKNEDGKDSRLLLQDDTSRENKEWTPERVESETSFAEGEQVRLSIESPRDGFLYVIDRELYRDGTFSEPYLIFPTLQNRNGNHAVAAGKLIEIPDKSAFRLKPLREDYKGESLTLIITKEPLAEIKVGATFIKLEAEMVGQWEKQWGVPVERFEMIGGAGKAYTKVEKEAGEGSRLLTQEDELPQTLYRVVTKTGNPILVTVMLRIGK